MYADYIIIYSIELYYVSLPEIIWDNDSKTMTCSFNKRYYFVCFNNEQRSSSNKHLYIYSIILLELSFCII